MMVQDGHRPLNRAQNNQKPGGAGASCNKYHFLLGLSSLDFLKIRLKEHVTEVLTCLSSELVDWSQLADTGIDGGVGVDVGIEV